MVQKQVSNMYIIIQCFYCSVVSPLSLAVLQHFNKPLMDAQEAIWQPFCIRLAAAH